MCMRAIQITLLYVLLLSCSNQPKEATSQSDSLQRDSETTEAESLKPEVLDSSTSIGEDECIFDVSTQTDDFVKGIAELANYTWDDASKTATILLENGDTLYAQRGGCYHFTYAGRLVTRDNHEVMDTAFWLNKGKWIADRVFRDYDKKLVDSLISNKIYTIHNDNEGLQVVFEGDHSYSEFIQFTKRKGEWTETLIGFYID